MKAPRARAENAQNCFLPCRPFDCAASAVLFLFNVIETKFLCASSTSEFSHSLGQTRTLRLGCWISVLPPGRDMGRPLRHVRFVPNSDLGSDAAKLRVHGLMS